jgi:Cu+-exporting ATPase
MSIMVGVGRGAQAGILIKNAEAIERLEKVTTLVLDKTGTLTEGKPRLTGVISTGWMNEDDLLTAAATAEQQSEHPLASAILVGAKDKNLPLEKLTSFSSTTGGGVTAMGAPGSILVGQPDFLRKNGISELEGLETRAQALQEEGQTVIFVAVNSRAAGILAVADPIRRSTPGALQALHHLGLKLIMLTGDNERTALAVAKQLEIDQMKAGVGPREKCRRVRLETFYFPFLKPLFKQRSCCPGTFN